MNTATKQISEKISKIVNKTTVNNKNKVYIEIS